MGILCIYLNNINRGNHFDEDNPDTIILVRIWFGILNLQIHITWRFDKVQNALMLPSLKI